MKTTNKHTLHTSVDKVLVIGCLSIVLALTGCEDKGTTARAGRKIDKAATTAGEKFDSVADESIGKVEEVKNDTVDAAEEAMENADVKVKQATANANDKFDQMTEDASNKFNQTTKAAGQHAEGAKDAVLDKAQSAGTYLDDSVITTAVKTAIVNDALLKASQIEITTTEGIVTLSGVADSEESINRAIQVVNAQANVKSVQSELVVNPAPSNP